MELKNTFLKPMNRLVIPAQAGIHTLAAAYIIGSEANLWIPACAGMTVSA
jgi:hypothetical protein